MSMELLDEDVTAIAFYLSSERLRLFTQSLVVIAMPYICIKGC
ncbi:MAG: hypothetical protein ACT6QU_18960 [Aliihoeflea sp.]